MIKKNKPVAVDFVCDLCEKASDRLYVVQKVTRGRDKEVNRRALGEYCGECVKKVGGM